MRVIKSLCCAAAIVLLAASVARADEWNKKTYLTFSGPVQIPGATLPAGTYLFQLADPDNARHVVMVASKDGTHIYGMFLTIPNDRLDTPTDNVVMFDERPAGAPQAVRAWWYPGDQFGEEFVYPKNQASLIAKANHTPVLAAERDAKPTASPSDRVALLRASKVGHVDESGDMNADTSSRAAAQAAPPNTVDGRNATAADSAIARADTTAKTATVGTSGRKSLPRTASDLELFELLSGLSLAAAFALRRVRASA